MNNRIGEVQLKEKLEQGFKQRNIDDEIEKLENRRKGITAFRDITPQDRKILADIDNKIKSLVYFKQQKNELVAFVDSIGDVTTVSGHKYTSSEMQEIIELVLKGKAKINTVTRSKNLRGQVSELLELQANLSSDRI